MIKKIALAVVLSTTALSAVAEESKDFYAQVNAGYAFGMKSKILNSSEKFKTGKSFSIGLEAGAQINEYLRAGLSFDYMPDFKVNMSKLNGTRNNDSANITDGVTTGKFKGNVEYAFSNPKIKSMNLMANLFIDAGNFSGFKPYAVVGLGLARNKTSNFDLNRTYKTGGTFTPEAGISGVTIKDLNSSDQMKGKTKNNFAFKVGLGFKYAINEDFDVDVRYQYLDLGKAEWKNAAGEKLTARVTANQLMLGVAYKF